jgi:hypothetical protein
MTYPLVYTLATQVETSGSHGNISGPLISGWAAQRFHCDVRPLREC